jgi:hypothetical protein
MLLATVLSFGAIFTAVPAAADEDVQTSRVLLISIDGLHAGDLARYVATFPNSALAQLSRHGRTYTNATSTTPSDSFPGMLAMVTGGTPRSTGVYYDDGWDRLLAAKSGPCVPGTRVRWKQNLDVAQPPILAGVLDPLQLPRNPADGCTTRVFPHQFPRVNNVFELIKAAGGHTAWSDKHPAYEFLNGPSGTGLDDLYTPEIASPAPLFPALGVITNSFLDTMNYDDLKVAVVLKWIKGLDHNGAPFSVPNLFGMNFQAVSVGQKLAQAGVIVGGYKDASGTPSSSLQTALDHTDASIGSMVAALRGAGLFDSTMIIISAKHGNSPIDLSRLTKVDPATISTIVNAVPPGGLLAQLSADTGPLIWLKDPSKAAEVMAALELDRVGANTTHTAQIFSGPAFFGVPATDNRVPDIVLIPLSGTLYNTSGTIIADHGSPGPDDTHVGLLVSNPSLPQKTINDPVETRQIACTILKALNMGCQGLTSQQTEPSKFLPNSNHDDGSEGGNGNNGHHH